MEIDSGAAASMLKSSLDQQTLGAQVVSSTLEKMNTDPVSGRVNQDFDFQTKVLASQGLGKHLNSSV